MAYRRLYLYLTVLLVISYAYLGWSLYHRNTHVGITVCMFKNITGIACPSCGSTRAIVLLTEGKMKQAALTNPLGYLIAFFMLILPFWLFYDMIFKTDTFYHKYRTAEKILSSKWVIIILISFVIFNWIWNIYKNL